MRVLEPHHFSTKNKPRKRRNVRKSLVVFAVAAIGLGLVGYVMYGQQVETVEHTPAVNIDEVGDDVSETPKTLKQFTNEQFKAAYSTFIYPNTQLITQAPEITGNAEADTRIRKIAAKRGYKLTALPVASIVKTGEPGLEGDDLIQPNAQIAWNELKSAAAAANIKLKMTSAYRSIDYQRDLFLRRMQNLGVTVYTIVEGYADDEVDAVLSRAALPGYSRHHTGYTIDLSCNGIGLEAFINTSCYDWLSQNNFENTKKFGWVPSYPEGVSDLGPEPEPWEFVWIGTGQTFE